MNTQELSSSSPENSAKRFRQLGKELMLYVVDGSRHEGREGVSWHSLPRQDKVFQAGCEALENAWSSSIQSLHASLLDQRLNELVSKAEKTLENRDAALRLRFYKELDIRRKVRPSFLSLELQDNFTAKNDAYTRSLKAAAVSGAVSSLPALVILKAFPIAIIIGSLAAVGAQKWKYPQEKARVRRQCAKEVDRLMTQAGEKSGALLQQAEQRFDEVFAEFLAT